MNHPVTRRELLKQLGLGAVAVAAAPLLRVHAEIPAPPATPAGFTLPKLPYAYAALEPHIDARTMEIHHTRHHQAFVDNLNKALKEFPALHAKPVEDLLRDLASVPEAIRTTVRNNGGGHHNHAFFWTCMSPTGGGEPTGALADALVKKFGGVAEFKKLLSEAGMKRFGSGWAWLVRTKAGELDVISTPNQDSPLMEGHTPLLGVDVWEHAYYLKYQNRRADYLAAWWNVVNWETVSAAFAAK